MIFYKTKKEEDPYYKLWKTGKWLFPVENAAKFDFPLTVSVEVTNRCSSNCLFCSRRLMQRVEGDMSMDCVEKIIMESSKHDAAVRHGGWGETLLHPQIEDIIEMSKKWNVLTTIFTNGFPLTENMAKSFIKSGLDEIRFSTTGFTEDQHNHIRKGSDYQRDIVEKIKMVHKLKKEMKSNKPYLTLYATVLNYDDENFIANMDKYFKYFLNYVDKVDVDLTNFSRVKLLHQAKEHYTKQSIVQEYKPCVDLFLKLIVHWNGDFFVCDEPYNFDETYFLGNINKGQKIEDGWKSKKMQKFRNDLAFQSNHANYNLCKDCFANTTKWDIKSY